MASVEISVTGFDDLRKNINKIASRVFPKFALLAEAIVKFGITPKDLNPKSEALYRARDYFHKQLRKRKRGDLYLRKYRSRGERMRRGK